MNKTREAKKDENKRRCRKFEYLREILKADAAVDQRRTARKA